MPATVDDFIKNFGGPGATDDQQASQYFDRFASTRPEDSQFDNQALHQGTTEYLGQLPPDQFHEAAQSAFSQAARGERQGLIGRLLGGLAGRGLNIGSVGSQLGLSSTLSRWGRRTMRDWQI